MSVPYGQTEPSVAAGWYQDPQGVAGHRWWDGARWTEHTQPAVAPAPEPWTAPMVSGGYGHPGHANQVSAFPASGYGSAPAYPGAVTGYPTAGWSGQAAGPLTKPKNGLATVALVLGILVLGVLLFLGYAIISAIAILVAVRAIKNARGIKAEGYPTAVGMGRAVTGLVLSGIGALLFLLSYLG